MARQSSVGSPTARHLALLAAVTTQSRGGKIEIAVSSGAKPTIVVPWSNLTDVVPVAFVGCFTGATHDYVFPLKHGINRIGRSAQWGDHAEAAGAERVMEPRQWLIWCRGTQALVGDDHSTNGSAVLPHDVPANAFDPDPRYASGAYSYSEMLQNWQSGLIRLDWQGTVTPDLRDGDVLLTMYGGFVFGLLPQGSSMA